MCAGSSGGGAAAAALAGGQAGLLPSCLSVDAAVGVLEEAIDWGRARAVWSAAAQVCVLPMAHDCDTAHVRWLQYTYEWRLMLLI